VGDRRSWACGRPKKLGLWKTEEVGLVKGRRIWACWRVNFLGLLEGRRF
jgi:hypothetical protein